MTIREQWSLKDAMDAHDFLNLIDGVRDDARRKQQQEMEAMRRGRS